MKIENAWNISLVMTHPYDVQLTLPKVNHIMLADQDTYPSLWMIGPIVALLMLFLLFVVGGGDVDKQIHFPKISSLSFPRRIPLL